MVLFERLARVFVHLLDSSSSSSSVIVLDFSCAFQCVAGDLRLRVNRMRVRMSCAFFPITFLACDSDCLVVVSFAAFGARDAKSVSLCVRSTFTPKMTVGGGRPAYRLNAHIRMFSNRIRNGSHLKNASRPREGHRRSAAVFLFAAWVNFGGSCGGGWLASWL